MTGFVVKGHICWFAAQETFLITINVENVLLNIFVKAFFRIIWWIENSKENNICETEILLSLWSI